MQVKYQLEFFLQLKKEPVKTNKIFFFGLNQKPRDLFFSRVHAYIFSYTVTKKKPLYYFMNKKSKEYTEMIEFSIGCRYFGFCNIQEIVYCLM